MPPKSATYWAEKAGRPGTVSYRNRWLDGYWERIRRVALAEPFSWVVDDLEKAFPTRLIRALDLGCGDGAFTNWLASKSLGRIRWIGADFYWYGGQSFDAMTAMSFMSGVDAEQADQHFAPNGFDLVTLNGVLECVDDWKLALNNALMIAPRVLLVEDLREKVPSYQLELDYKHAISWPEFVAHVKARGDVEVVGFRPVTVIDRALFVRTPERLWPLVMIASLAIDAVLTRWLPDSLCSRFSRFRAVYLKRKELIA
jgi:SAM-dependent methyltransferase